MESRTWTWRARPSERSASAMMTLPSAESDLLMLLACRGGGGDELDEGRAGGGFACGERRYDPARETCAVRAPRGRGGGCRPRATNLLEAVAAGVRRLLTLAAGEVHQVEARVPLLGHAIRRHKRALHLPSPNAPPPPPPPPAPGDRQETGLRRSLNPLTGERCF